MGIVVSELVTDNGVHEMNLLNVIEIPGEMEYLNDAHFSKEGRVYLTWTHKSR